MLRTNSCPCRIGCRHRAPCERTRLGRDEIAFHFAHDSGAHPLGAIAHLVRYVPHLSRQARTTLTVNKTPINMKYPALNKK